jgi:hypothetical protein
MNGGTRESGRARGEEGTERGEDGRGRIKTGGR